MLHPIWHIFWRLTWYEKWYSIWHIFYFLSISHCIRHSIYMLFYLALYLSINLTFSRAPHRAGELGVRFGIWSGDTQSAVKREGWHTSWPWRRRSKESGRSALLKSRGPDQADGKKSELWLANWIQICKQSLNIWKVAIRANVRTLLSLQGRKRQDNRRHVCQYLGRNCIFK